MSLSVTRLSVSYGRTPVLKDLSLEPMAPGEVISIIGPNAAGKTTLLRALAGLSPASGSIRLGRQELSELPLAERARLVSYMPQALPQRVALTVLEAVLGALRVSAFDLVDASPSAPRSEDDLVDRALEVIDEVGIESLAMRGLDQLSGGQRQLASLAQSLVRRPRVLLLDEPISALDLHYQLRVMKLVRRVAREHGTIVVLVLHDLAVAARWSERVIVLSGGGVAADGPPAEAITPALLAGVYRVAGRVESTEAPRPRLHVEIDDILPLSDGARHDHE